MMDFDWGNWCMLIVSNVMNDVDSQNFNAPLRFGQIEMGVLVGLEQ